MNKPMRCPKCSSLMNQIKTGEHTVDRCSRCAGLWFDLREHEHIAENRRNVQSLDAGDPGIGEKQNANRDILCPVCNVKMIKISVPEQLHIKYENCPICHGVFFDAGEFKDYAKLTLSEQITGFFKGFR